MLKLSLRTSLVVQWIGSHLPVQEMRFQSLVWEDPTCCRAAKPEHHDHEPVCLEPLLHNEKSLQGEAHPPGRRVAPAHHNYRQACEQQWRLSAAKNSLFLIVYEHHLMTVSWYISLLIIIYLLISSFLQAWKDHNEIKQNQLERSCCMELTFLSKRPYHSQLYQRYIQMPTYSNWYFFSFFDTSFIFKFLHYFDYQHGYYCLSDILISSFLIYIS